MLYINLQKGENAMLGNLFSVGAVTPAVDLTNALTNASSQVTGQLSSVAPIAISVMGAILAVTFGVKFFKKLAKG